MGSQDNFWSRFATRPEDLEIVLDIRRQYFKDRVVSSDESYRKCYSRNAQSMKLVYRNGGAEGYWSLIPITEEAFRKFLQGNYSHEQMLSQQPLPWTEVRGTNAFIYIVGAVVRRKTPGLNKRVARQVILDWLSFIVQLMARFDIRGMCGYPSRDSGQKLFERFGFTRTGVLIENDPKQPVYDLEGESITSLKARLNHALSGDAEIPVWDGKDRAAFWQALAELGGPVSVSPK